MYSFGTLLKKDTVGGDDGDELLMQVRVKVLMNSLSDLKVNCARRF